MKHRKQKISLIYDNEKTQRREHIAMIINDADMTVLMELMEQPLPKNVIDEMASKDQHIPRFGYYKQHPVFIEYIDRLNTDISKEKGGVN